MGRDLLVDMVDVLLFIRFTIYLGVVGFVQLIALMLLSWQTFVVHGHHPACCSSDVVIQGRPARLFRAACSSKSIE